MESPSPKNKRDIFDVLSDAKALAIEYRTLTGKPLGITGELAEYEAARRLELELAEARQEGYDATEGRGGKVRRLQIKGRRILRGDKRSQMVPGIRIDKEWDAVLLVILDDDFDVTEIHEAERDIIVDTLMAPGSKARNERGAMAVSKFKSIGRCRWRDGHLV